MAYLSYTYCLFCFLSPEWYHSQGPNSAVIKVEIIRDLFLISQLYCDPIMYHRVALCACCADCPLHCINASLSCHSRKQSVVNFTSKPHSPCDKGIVWCYHVYLYMYKIMSLINAQMWKKTYIYSAFYKKSLSKFFEGKILMIFSLTICVIKSQRNYIFPVIQSNMRSNLYVRLLYQQMKH